jgi:hypothetical protein
MSAKKLLAVLTIIVAIALLFPATANSQLPKSKDSSAETYEQLATAIIAIRKTEDGLVKGIILHAQGSAAAALARPPAPPAAPRSRPWKPPPPKSPTPPTKATNPSSPSASASPKPATPITPMPRPRKIICGSIPKRKNNSSISPAASANSATPPTSAKPPTS